MLTSTEARTLTRAPTLKFTGLDGTFEGYASLFHVADQGRDIMLPGAFRDSLRAKGAGGIRLLFQHKPEEPIGVWEEIREDRRGLHVRGRLATDVARAREVLALMRAGALDGLSIGFRVVSARRDPIRRLRLIARVDLWEISVVTFPMLTGARIHRVGAQGDTPALATRDASLPHEIAALARRMRARLALDRPRSPTARSAELAGERALLALMQEALIPRV